MHCYLLVVISCLAWSASGITYNEQLAKDMLVYSAAAYSDDPQSCTYHASDFQIEDTIVYKPSSGALIYGYIGISKNNQAIVVAFRGTDGISQLMSELYDSAGEWYPAIKGAKVVKYFYDSFVGVNDELQTKVASVMSEYSGFQLYITGHSLGGALASLAAYAVKQYKPIVYTFGEPRVGTWDYADGYNAEIPNHIRVTHSNDAVVHVVPCPTSASDAIAAALLNGTDPVPNANCYPGSSSMSWPNYGYHEGGTNGEIFYPNKMPNVDTSVSGTYQHCTGSPAGEDPDCSASKWASSVSDHTHYFDVEVGYYCSPNGIRRKPRTL